MHTCTIDFVEYSFGANIEQLIICTPCYVTKNIGRDSQSCTTRDSSRSYSVSMAFIQSRRHENLLSGRASESYRL